MVSRKAIPLREAHHEGITENYLDFERMFNPRKIAILGVSLEKESVGLGNGILLALLKMGFEGKIFPINPRGGTFAGLNILKSVEDISEEIDFAIIAVAAKWVPESLDACRRKGAKGAQIISSGFSELGTPYGAALEHEIQTITQKGIRVIGPNCFGIYCPKSGLTFMPNPDLSRESGPVAFLSQSGGMASDFANTGKWMGLRFSKVVSFGNGADLREVDFLRYLASDAETRVISMYVEGVKDGKRFFQTLKSTTQEKPVIVYKGGLSVSGRRAVVSHTASMGGNRIIWSAILKQANAVHVQDMQEMAQSSLAFALLPSRPFKSVSVIGGGGALGVAACDAAEPYKIDIPEFSPELKACLGSVLPQPGSSAANPVDVANPFIAPEMLKKVLQLSARDERVELQVVISLLYHFKAIASALGKPVAEVAPFQRLADVIAEVSCETGKPSIVVLPNPKRGLEDMDVVEMQVQARKTFLERGIPVFDEIGEVFRAIGHMNTYFSRKGERTG